MPGVVGATMLTVIYDGHCYFCVRSVRQLERWDTEGTVEFLDSHTTAVHARYPSISEAELEGALQLIASDGTRWSGADAFETLVKVLPPVRLLRWAFRVPFGRVLAHRIYARVARNRARLGCGDHCRSRRPF